MLRILAGRRRSLGEDHTRMIAQVHQLLLELIPGGAKTALSAAQAKVLLATVRPRDAAGKARRRVAAELISDLERIYQRKKAADKELRELLKTTGTTLTGLNGIGPSVAARLLTRPATSPGSPPKRTSHHGMGPHRSTPPPATRFATGSRAPATSPGWGGPGIYLARGSGAFSARGLWLAYLFDHLTGDLSYWVAGAEDSLCIMLQLLE